MSHPWLLTLCLAALVSGVASAEGTQEKPMTADTLLAGAPARIEKYRKADATLVLVDRKGKPLPHVPIKIEQINHDFLFGCAALSLLKHEDKSQEQAYQKQFGELFNFATVLTYWQDTEPEQGRLHLEGLAAQVQRLREMGIKVKGHPLILAGACPRWVPADPDAVRALNQKHIHDLVTRFKGQIEVWDVVGDVTTASGVQNGLGAWARKAGPTQFTADALTWARQSDPNALLMYNDYKLDADYTDLVGSLRKTRAPLDTLGLEAHMVGSEWPMEKAWQTTETFGALDKPLHYSEITVLSDDPKADHSKAWPTTPEGEQRQAEYVERLYTLLFSHPSVHAIAWWNFVDGDWDRIPGGLLRTDLTPKPGYERLHRLIKETWRTREEQQTDAQGRVKFRGFTGHYRFTLQTTAGTETREADVRQGKPNQIKLRLK